MVIVMNLKLILKSFIVGIGKIIPGVSGSMLAITLGIYESIIEAITNFFSNTKANLKLLLNFSIGIFLAILLFSRLLIFLLNNYYEVTMYLFLGLIVGTLLPFTKELKFTQKNTLVFLIFLIITLILTFVTTTNNYVFNNNILDYVYTFFLGVIDAFTSIIPGISGTIIFMLLGSYEYVLSILANPFNFIFIIYGVGMISGIIIICHIMRYLLKHYKDTTCIAIFAFMVSSITILFLSLKNFLNPFLFIIFILGAIGGYMLEYHK